MMNLIGRRDATQATLDKWLNTPFSWGNADCARMVIDHLRNMGHRPKIAKSGGWKTAASARAAIKRMGHADLIEVLDGWGLPRIEGAQAVAGDIAAIEADSPLGCLCVCIGPNQWLSLHEVAEGFTIVEISDFKAAWRIEWQKQ
jgi:hypothetical protein